MAESVSNIAFHDVVSKLLQSWDVLQHAVDSNFGGIHSKAKAEWLESVIVTFFNENLDLKPPEVHDFIAEIMDNEFNLIVEDVSLLNLSKNLCKCFAWSKVSDEQTRLSEFLSKIKPIDRGGGVGGQLKIQIQSNPDDDSSSSDDEDLVDSDEPMEVETTPKEASAVTVQNSNAGSAAKQKDVKVSDCSNVEEDGWTVVAHKKK